MCHVSVRIQELHHSREGLSDCQMVTFREGYIELCVILKEASPVVIPHLMQHGCDIVGDEAVSL